MQTLSNHFTSMFCRGHNRISAATWFCLFKPCPVDGVATEQHSLLRFKIISDKLDRKQKSGRFTQINCSRLKKRGRSDPPKTQFYKTHTFDGTIPARNNLATARSFHKRLKKTPAHSFTENPRNYSCMRLHRRLTKLSNYSRMELLMKLSNYSWMQLYKDQ